MSVFVVVKALFVLTVALASAPLVAWAERRRWLLVASGADAPAGETFPERAARLRRAVTASIRRDRGLAEGMQGVGRTLAPLLAVVPALVGFGLVPFGLRYELGGETVVLVGADLDVGALVLGLLFGVATVGCLLAAGTSEQDDALPAGLRDAAQRLWAQVALGLALVPMLALYGSLRLSDIAQAQDTTFAPLSGLAALGMPLPGWAELARLPAWGALRQPLAFLLAIVCGLSIVRRAPFAAPARGDLPSAIRRGNAGVRLALFELADLLQRVLVAALIVTFFLGGPSVPWLSQSEWIGLVARVYGEGFATITCMVGHVAVFLAKVSAVLWLELRVRGAKDRPRVDALLVGCWRWIVPLGLVNVVATALIALALQAHA